MSIEILKDYITLCKDLNIAPNWEGLKDYKEGLKRNVLIIK